VTTPPPDPSSGGLGGRPGQGPLINDDATNGTAPGRSGLVVAVTGGQSGIGAAAVARMRADGHEVISIDRVDGADLVLDISSPDAVRAGAAILGRVDVLINSAGVMGPNLPVVDTAFDDWCRTIEINLHGTFLMSQAVVGGMRDRGWGRIVNLSSMAGKEGHPLLAAYSASKAAIISLTKSMGKEHARDGIAINVITPAVIDTPMPASMGGKVDQYAAAIPMGRAGHAEEVAELIAWLSSDRCSFSTGAVYDISGGKAVY
jgi:NAD(P)-dependent dehydrogenase (short-subunit alcohol dehydrogenase family)